MARHTFSETDDYLVEWEILGTDCHVHCEVLNWNKSILKRLYVEFVRLKDFVRELGYSYMVSNTPNPKFCELFGARYVGSIKEGYEVMIWETAPIGEKQP